MKKDIHPESYRTVVFKDVSNDEMFVSRSTANSKETIEWEDGNEYPLIKVEISSTSHPFYTGKMKLVDTAGRIDKFRNRYNRHLNTSAAAAEEAPATEAPAEEPAKTEGEGES